MAIFTFRTKSYIIAKRTRRGWEVFHARPGTTKKEAWENATGSVKIPRRVFTANGWECKEIHIFANGLSK